MPTTDPWPEHRRESRPSSTQAREGERTLNQSSNRSEEPRRLERPSTASMARSCRPRGYRRKPGWTGRQSTTRARPCAAVDQRAHPGGPGRGQRQGRSPELRMPGDHLAVAGVGSRLPGASLTVSDRRSPTAAAAGHRVLTARLPTSAPDRRFAEALADLFGVRSPPVRLTPSEPRPP
jgi:hypothetical protein